MKVLSKFFAFAVVPAVALVSGCASVQPYGVVDGKIVLDSPFALQVGSTEYAAAFGDLIRTSVSANYDPETKVTKTNFYHYANARLKEPYYGHSQVSLSFRGEEKTLEGVYLPSMGRRFQGKVSSYSECRKQVEEVARDIERRLGVRMECAYEEGEEVAKRGMERLVENKRKGRSHGLTSTSFLRYAGHGKGAGCDVQYSVTGMYGSDGNFSLNVEYRRPFEFESRRNSYKPGDKIPVYTNTVDTSFRKEQEEKRMKRHAEAAKLREVLKRTFSTDFDETNKTSRATIFNPSDAIDWKPLEISFEGATERRDSRPGSRARIPHRTFSVRRAYDGDVEEAELKAQAGRFLSRLERDLGAKVEKCEKSLCTELQKEVMKRGETGVPAFGDFRLMIGLDKRQFFFGRMGDVYVEICYLPPRYEKAGDRYDLASRGAVIMTFTQAPNAD